MKENKKRKIKFFVLECKDKEAHGNYYQGSRILCTSNVLDAKRYKKKDLKKNNKKKFNARKVTVKVH